MSKFDWVLKDEAVVGHRLDKVVSLLLPQEYSRALVQKLIELGQVFINGKVKNRSYKTKKDDHLMVDLSEVLKEKNKVTNPEAQKIPLDILFEDDHLIFVNKPAGLVVHPGAGKSDGTLTNALLNYCGDTLPSLGEKSRAGLVHRLDKETSGVMVVAKSLIALNRLAAQFAKHNHKKIYLAIVAGKVTKQKGEIFTWHGRHPNFRTKYSVQPEGKGKEAKMRYKVLESFGQNQWHLVECTLLTGRTHQIRVQLAHIGLFILGDKLYGKPGKTDKILDNTTKKNLLEIERQMLHAYQLEVEHPVSESSMTIQADQPEDFKEVFKSVTKFIDRNKSIPNLTFSSLKLQIGFFHRTWF